MRRAARTDHNHAHVLKQLRLRGWSCKSTHQLKNFCDIVASKNSHTVLIEVKDPNKPPSQRKLTKGELEFAQSWLGEYIIIETLEDIEELNMRFSDNCKACRNSRTDAECAAKNYRRLGWVNVKVIQCKECKGWKITKTKALE